MVRVLREGWAVRGDPLAAGWMVSGRFGPLHPRAPHSRSALPCSFVDVCGGGRDKLAAAGSGSGTLAVSLAPAPTRCDGVTAALPVLPGGNRVPR